MNPDHLNSDWNVINHGLVGRLDPFIAETDVSGSASHIEGYDLGETRLASYFKSPYNPARWS
jgi:hypothetical protein